MKAFKPAKIYRGKKEWFIYYSYLNPATGKYQRFKDRGPKVGLNREKDPKEREKIAQDIKRGWNELLQDGYNPFLTLEEVTKNENIEAGSLMFVTQALDYALEGKAYKKKSTANDRRSTIGILKNAFVKAKVNVMISDLTGKDIMKVMDWLTRDRDLSNTNFNKYLETLKSMLNFLVEKFIIPFNPAAPIKRKKKEKPKAHRPLTDQERATVFAHLKKAKPEFYTYCKIIYRTLIRPNEILDLKPRHIDLVNLRIMIDEDSAKDDEERFVAVDADLMTDIAMIVDKCGQDDYLFSHNLLPGPVRINRNRASEIWLDIVKKGLEINKSMYSLKHTGVNTRRRMGNTLLDASKLAGHSDVKMTLNYATEEQILEDERIRKIIPPCE